MWRRRSPRRRLPVARSKLRVSASAIRLEQRLAAGRGPCPSITTSSAPGIAAAVARPPETPISGSSAPWMTTVGAVIARELRACGPARRGSPRAGAPCRRGRSRGRRRARRARGSPPRRRARRASRWPGGRPRIRRCTRPARSAGAVISTARRLRARAADGAVAGRRHDRGEREHAVGKSIATRWAIIPPSEAPTTCARSIPSSSSRPTASAAMSSSRYGGSPPSPLSDAARCPGSRARRAWSSGRSRGCRTGSRDSRRRRAARTARSGQ